MQKPLVAGLAVLALAVSAPGAAQPGAPDQRARDAEEAAYAARLESERQAQISAGWRAPIGRPGQSITVTQDGSVEVDEGWARFLAYGFRFEGKQGERFSITAESLEPALRGAPYLSLPPLSLDGEGRAEEISSVPATGADDFVSARKRSMVFELGHDGWHYFETRMSPSQFSEYRITLDRVN